MGRVAVQRGLDCRAQGIGAFALAAAAACLATAAPDGLAILAIEEMDAHHRHFLFIGAQQRRAAPGPVAIPMAAVAVIAADIVVVLALAFLQAERGADLQITALALRRRAQAVLI